MRLIVETNFPRGRYFFLIQIHCYFAKNQQNFELLSNYKHYQLLLFFKYMSFLRKRVIISQKNRVRFFSKKGLVLQKHRKLLCLDSLLERETEKVFLNFQIFIAAYVAGWTIIS